MPTNKKQKKLLPKDFRGYFWDCDFSQLTLNIYRNFILKRLLQYGGKDALVWVLKNFSASEVRSILNNKGKKELDKRSFVFWQKLSKTPELWK
jgi:hypothetical protein